MNSNNPIFSLDEIQTNFYKLLSLFYSGIGIIQRDAPARNEKENTDAILRLENNIKEIIGQFITTKEKLMTRVDEIEKREKTAESLEELIEKTRTLDKELENKVELLESELPLLKESIDDLISEICEI